jgi:hypothetical protein
MVSQRPPRNVPKCHIAKKLVEDNEIQDLTNHKRTNKWGDEK